MSRGGPPTIVVGLMARIPINIAELVGGTPLAATRLAKSMVPDSLLSPILAPPKRTK